MVHNGFFTLHNIADIKRRSVASFSKTLIKYELQPISVTNKT